MTATNPRHLEEWLEQTGLSVDALAVRSRIPTARIQAMLDGRWTAAPEDRRRIADALQLTVDQIIWGHTMTSRVVRYHQFGIQDPF